MPQAKTAPTESAEPQATATGLQTAVTVFVMGIVGMVVGTALYGPPENSDRAFRLLHWWKRAPQPEPEAPTAPARRRVQRTKGQ